MLLLKTLKCPLDCKDIKPVNPKEISPEYSLEGLMLKLKLSDAKNRHIGKEPDGGKD